MLASKGLLHINMNHTNPWLHFSFKHLTIVHLPATSFDIINHAVIAICCYFPITIKFKMDDKCSRVLWMQPGYRRKGPLGETIVVVVVVTVSETGS